MKSERDNNGISLCIFVSLLKTSYKLFWILSWLLLFIAYIKVKLKATLNFVHFQSREHFCHSVEYIDCVCPNEILT